MDQEKDIYKTPAPAGTPPEPKPIMDLPRNRVRERTLRSSIGFTLLMLLVLGVAWWFASRQEEKDKTSRTPAPTPETAIPQLPERAPPAAVSVAPELGDLSDILRPEERAGLSALDQEKVAQAMGEIRIASQYLQTRDWDNAELHARKALDVWPKMIAAERLLGFVYSQRGQFDQAIAMLEHSLIDNPFNPETFNNLASAYLQKWELDKAEELLLTSLKIQPDYVVAHLNMGLLYLVSGSGKYEMAIDHLQRALELLPDNISARNNLAVALLRVGRYDEARTHLQFIIERMPGRASAYFNMAITYVLERNFDEAMKWIDRGARWCSPVLCRNYLADSDFDSIRDYPPYQTFLKNLYPDLPAIPEG